MIPTVWYIVELLMVENQRGSMNLLFQDYKYSVDRINKNKTTMWRCSKKNRGCLARVNTRGNNQLRIGIHPHIHGPVSAEESGKFGLPASRDIEREPFDIKDVLKLEFN